MTNKLNAELPVVAKEAEGRESSFQKDKLIEFRSQLKANSLLFKDKPATKLMESELNKLDADHPGKSP